MGDNEAAASNSTGASALSSPAFRTYLCGILAANIGFRMQSIALGILVYRTTGSALVIGLSFVPSFQLVLVLAFLAHAGNGLFSNSCTVALQARIPEPVRGRVMGTVSVAFNLGTFGGMWTGGAITLVGDVRWGMAIGPLAMLGIVLLVLATQRQIRGLADV